MNRKVFKALILLSAVLISGQNCAGSFQSAVTGASSASSSGPSPSPSPGTPPSPPSNPSGPGGSTYALPSDRVTTWLPGVTYNGGIPSGSWPVSATLSPSGGDDVTPIQNAINAAHAAHPNGVVVALTAGTFNFNSGFVLIPSHTVLRGAGAGNTILIATNGATTNSDQPGKHVAPLVIIGPNRYDNGPSGDPASINLTADAVAGSYSVNVATTTGLSVGLHIKLDEVSGATWQTDPQGMGQILASSDFRVVWQLHKPGLQTDDPITYPASGSKPNNAALGNGSDAASWFSRQDRPQAEVKEIASISGSLVTFTTPIHIAYRVSHFAQVAPYQAGVSAFTVQGGLEGVTGKNGDDGCFRFSWAARSWMKNVEVTNWLGEGVAIDNSFGCELRDSYIHDAAWAQPGGAGYAVSLSFGSSEFLMENSISIRANKVMVARAAGAGSVIGYNYVEDGYINTNGSWIECGINGSHMVGAHHMLFEGNQAFNWDSDKTHGNATYHVVFRNWLLGQRKSFVNPLDGQTYDDSTQSGHGPYRASGPAAFGYWHSFVGNVLGVSGQMTGWTYEDDSNGVMVSGTKAIWALGWDDWVSAYPNVKPDINVSSGSRAILRDGNWDWLTKSVHWHNSAAAPLPNSFYMSGKPAFFGTNTWPWVDPTNGNTYTLPAKARYDAGTPNVVP